MKKYQKPKLTKHSHLKNVTFSQEEPRQSILRPFSDYVKESEEHAKQERGED